MFQSGSWSWLFFYKENTHRDSILQVLSTFKVDRGLVRFDKVSSIRFKLFEEQWWLSFTDFSLLSGLYDTGFINTRSMNS